MKNIAKELENLPIYDQILQSIQFDFEKNQVQICIEYFDSQKNDYENLYIYLKNIHSFSSEYPKDITFSPNGVHSVSCRTINEKEYESHWIFQIQDMPLWVVKIGFSDLEMVGNCIKNFKNIA